MSAPQSYKIEEFTKHFHHILLTSKINPLILPITLFANRDICEKLRIQKYSYQLISEQKNEDNKILAFIVYNQSVPKNTILAPFNIIDKLSHNIFIRRVNLGIFAYKSLTVQKFESKDNIRVYPKLPIAQQLCVYLNDKSEFSSFLSKFFGKNMFVVPTTVKQVYFNVSWIPEQLVNQQNFKFSRQMRRTMAQNKNIDKFVNHLKIRMKGILPEQSTDQWGYCLFQPTKTKIFIQKAPHYQIDDLTKRIILPSLYMEIFQTTPYKHLSESISPILSQKPDKKLILLKSQTRSLGLSSFFHNMSQNTQSYNFVKINCRKIFTEKKLYENIKKCQEYGSTIIYIKNLSWIIEAQTDFNQKKTPQESMKCIMKNIQQIVSKMGDKCLQSFVIVISYQRKQIMLDMVKNAKMQIFQLSPQQKINLLETVCQFYRNRINIQEPKQVCKLLKNTLGWKVFSHVLSSILRNNKQNLPIKIGSDEILKEVSRFIDVEKVENIKNIGWDDVGGLKDAKQEIIQTILLPVQHPQIFDEWIKPRTGILFFGPPGTGKTMLGKCIANQCKMGFISVKGPQLLNMYIGQSEKNVRQVFQRAKAHKPCIIFMDELDALIPKRGQSSDSNQVMDRIVSELLAQMDQIAGKGIFVIGATNRPDLLDPSILRPGRFDKQLYLGIMNDLASRRQVLQAQTRNLTLRQGFDYQKVLQKVPQNFTGADFYGLTSKSIMKAAERCIEKYDNAQDNTDNKVILNEDDFVDVVVNMKPSVSNQELMHYEKLREQYK